MEWQPTQGCETGTQIRKLLTRQGSMTSARAPHNRFEGLDNGMITIIRPFVLQIMTP